MYLLKTNSSSTNYRDPGPRDEIVEQNISFK